MTEFATSRHLVDPISQFLAMDVDLDGLLGAEEMEALPAWGPPGKNWLPGFDDNGDGFYSMSEFRLIPQVNLLTTWHGARDADNNSDKLLDAEEMATDAGANAVSPGTVTKPRATRTPVTDPETRFWGMDGRTMQNFVMIEVVFVLLAAAGIFVFRRKRASSIAIIGPRDELFLSHLTVARRFASLSNSR